MKRHLINQSRAGTHFATSQLARVAVALLLVLSNSLTALALNEGPWTYDSHRWGSCSMNMVNSIAFWGLGNSSGWGTPRQWQDGNGTGFTIEGTSGTNDKFGVFSVYTHTENVPSYTRKVLNWTYEVKINMKAHWNTVALYARNDVNALKSMNADFTQGWWDQSGSQYCFYHYLHNSYGTYSSGNRSKQFSFDNRNSSSAQNKTWGLMLTHLVSNSGGSYSGIKEWAGFKNISTSWTYYYYKHVTFDSNGGSGSMEQQSIENSGTFWQTQVASAGSAEGSVCL